MYRNKKKKRPQMKMIYEQKWFHSADTKYYADLNQILWDCIHGMIITFLVDVSLKTLLKEVPVNI